MEVICKSHKFCIYSETCTHAKIHDVITSGFPPANNCITLKKRSTCITVHGVAIECYCSNTFLRKDKLNKLKEL